MQARFDLITIANAGYKAMLGVHSYVQNCGLDPALVELVKMRVSQINGCAFCLSMHADLARRTACTMTSWICWSPGVNPPYSMHANGLLWLGLRA